ncbi:hypothetical protein [Micromonospora ureilytica]|uniref:hypothetical protein n=1 Tax=Micromonospora ureilytica TaxID=709868 RepID=UPI002E1672A7|nr:hypothetical protein OHB55_24745 [Micromonospora ureilytica]
MGGGPPLTAVAVGVGVAVVLALRAVARSARLEQVPLRLTGRNGREARDRGGSGQGSRPATAVSTAIMIAAQQCG